MSAGQLVATAIMLFLAFFLVFLAVGAYGRDAVPFIVLTAVVTAVFVWAVG